MADEEIFNIIGEPDGWIPRALNGQVLKTKRSPVTAFRSSAKPSRDDRFVMNLFMLSNGVPPSLLKRWYKRKFGFVDGSDEFAEVDDTLKRVKSGRYNRYWDVTAQSYADQMIPDERDWRVSLNARPKMIERKGRAIMTEDLPLGPPRKFKRPTIKGSSKIVVNPYKKKKTYGSEYIEYPYARPARRTSPAKKISPVYPPDYGMKPNSTTGRSIPSKKIANPYKKRAAPMTALESLKRRYNNY